MPTSSMTDSDRDIPFPKYPLLQFILAGGKELIPNMAPQVCNLLVRPPKNGLLATRRIPWKFLYQLS